MLSSTMVSAGSIRPISIKPIGGISEACCLGEEIMLGVASYSLEGASASMQELQRRVDLQKCRCCI
jgi:hypothetical protein